MEPQLHDKWPSYPYKGLQFYEAQDAPIFAGREADIRTCADLIADDTARILVLHGNTGCGKSSFLRAGLIPLLERNSFEFFKERTRPSRALLIRCTDTPIARLVEGIYRYIEQSEKTDYTQHALMDAKDEREYCLKASTDSRFLLRSLKHLGGARPKTLVFVIDQAEEVLTLNSQKKNVQEQFFSFIQSFIRAEYDIRIILTVRADYLSEFQGGLEKAEIPFKGAHSFQLEELKSEERLAEVISRPTSTTEDFPGYGPPRSRYRFQFARGLPEKIIDDIQATHPSRQALLPAVQLYCLGLFTESQKCQQRDDIVTINESLYEEYKSKVYEKDVLAESLILNQIDTSIRLFYVEKAQNARKHSVDPCAVAEAQKHVAESLVTPWKQLLAALTDNQPAGPVTRLIAEHDLHKQAEALGCNTDFEGMMRHLSNHEQRILRTDKKSDARTATTETYLSLGHDVIGLGLEYWKRTIVRKHNKIKKILGLVGAGIFGVGIASVAFSHVKDFLNRPNEHLRRLEDVCKDRKDQTSCGRLLNLVETPCLQQSEPNSCRILGFLETQALVKDLNLNDALRHYNTGCVGGIKQSCYEAGMLIDSGVKPLTPDKTAYYYYKQSCEGRSILGCTQLGLIIIRLSHDPHSPESEELFSKSCANHDVLGCLQLGMLYENTPGYSLKAASKFYEQACNGGVAQSCRQLGSLYQEGRSDIQKDRKRAIFFYQKACSLHDELQCIKVDELKRQQ